MGALSVPVILSLLAVSVPASLCVLFVLGLVRPLRQVPQLTDSAALTNTVLLTQAGQVVDHDISAPPDLLRQFDQIRQWPDLRAWLGGRFADLPERLDDLPENAELRFAATDARQPAQLGITRQNSAIRVALSSDALPTSAQWHSMLCKASAFGQSQTVLDHAPIPAWVTDEDGRVLWRNKACSEIAGQLGPTPMPTASEADARPRFSVSRGGSDHLSWYEVRSRHTGEDTLNFAIEIDEVIRAETARREFMQTLTKTFANLTTGLAVFDRTRQLALFNPALVDLTGLPVGFLSARPDVIRFFDELRDRKVLPEPKNYADWRTTIRDMIDKAHIGQYQETWTVSVGVTYRVTGRPHPDGAVAFLFEDISAEILQTRQYRTQIDLGQAVIDGVDEAVIVISSGNLIMLCNAAASGLIGIDPDASFADMSVQDLIRACEEKFAQDGLWPIFEASLRSGLASGAGSGARFVNTKTGRHLRYRIKTLTGGVRLLSFSDLPEAAGAAGAKAVNAAE